MSPGTSLNIFSILAAPLPMRRPMMTQMLQQRGMSFGLESGRCPLEALKLAASLVPKPQQACIPDTSPGPRLNQGLCLPSTPSLTSRPDHWGRLVPVKCKPGGYSWMLKWPRQQFLAPNSHLISSAASHRVPRWRDPLLLVH